MRRLLVVVLILGAACVSESGLELTAEDGTTIVADYLEGDGDGVILVHMLDGDRHDWGNLAEKLNEAGYAVMSIDLRGHGESYGNWKTFSGGDFGRMVLDIKAAKKFLGRPVHVIGASIGANVASRYAASEGAQSMVLLSPGENYRELTLSIEYDGPALLVYSKEDSYSAETVEKIQDKFSGETEKLVYESAGHGTAMLANTDLETRILAWLDLHSSP